MLEVLASPLPGGRLARDVPLELQVAEAQIRLQFKDTSREPKSKPRAHVSTNCAVRRAGEEFKDCKADAKRDQEMKMVRGPLKALLSLQKFQG